jgi:hypothetical protein
MVGFGYKNAWWAVRDTEPQQVIAALGLRDLGPVPWRTAVDLAYLSDERLLVTPPLPGAADAHWVIAAGRWLLVDTAPVDATQLSALLNTEVQAFATHRVVELHSWQLAAGSGQRAVYWSGRSGTSGRAARLRTGGASLTRSSCPSVCRPPSRRTRRYSSMSTT